LPFLPLACDNTEPAKDLSSFVLLGFNKTLEAFDASFVELCFLFATVLILAYNNPVAYIGSRPLKTMEI
jgi:hypothetical protein